jgi:type IV pilus assembly protein PilC
MPEFACRVGTPTGDVRVETHVAPDEGALRQELERRDLHVFEIRSRHAGLRIAGLQVGGGAKKVPRRQFLLFNQELVTLLRAGLPLVQCLDVLLERLKPGPFQRYLTDIRDRVRSGLALSEAFQAQGEAFPRIYAASLTAGERSGELATVMARYVQYTKKTEAIRTRVTAALIYPGLLTAMSGALIALLMFYILPKFSTFYAEFDAELPTITVVVITLAGWLHRHGLVFLALAVGSVIGGRAWAATPAGRLFFDARLLQVPFVGAVLRMYNIAQFSRTLATLLAGGIPLVSALQTATGALGNTVFVKAIDAITEDVRQGKSLWESMDRTGVMSDLAIEMVKVGEATGSLGTMLGNIAEFYDEQVDDSMTRIVSLFEPILLITMGGIVATILLAMYMPIFQLAGSGT